MVDDRYALLHPPQISTTLRSLPRRYREALTLVPRRSEAIHERIDGHTVLDLLVDTACTLGLLDRALEQTLVRPAAPTLVAAITDPELRLWTADPLTGPEQLVETIAETAEATAARVYATPTKAWSRPAIVVGGGTVHAIDIAREAARVGVENLRRIERIAPRLRR